MRGDRGFIQSHRKVDNTATNITITCTVSPGVIIPSVILACILTTYRIAICNMVNIYIDTGQTFGVRRGDFWMDLVLLWIHTSSYYQEKRGALDRAPSFVSPRHG